MALAHKHTNGADPQPMTDTDQEAYMTEADEPTDETPDEAGIDERSFGLFAERQSGALTDHFASEETLLAYIESGRELTALEGIGRVTESRVLQYVEREHPEAYEAHVERKEYVLFDGDVHTPRAGPSMDTPRTQK